MDLLNSSLFSAPFVLAVSPAASDLVGFITNSILVALVVLGVVYRVEFIAHLYLSIGLKVRAA